MKNAAEPPGTRREPPVLAYGLILAALVLAVVAAVFYGQRHENPQPSPVSSPQPGASTGATPRY